MSTTAENLNNLIARAAFNAYNECVEPGKTPWKTWDGKDVPTWDLLNDSVRAKWCAAVDAALDLI